MNGQANSHNERLPGQKNHTEENDIIFKKGISLNDYFFITKLLFTIQKDKICIIRMGMKFFTFLFCLISTYSQASVFSIDFRNGTWDHSAVGGPDSSTGWATTSMTNPTSTRGYSSGTTQVQPGLSLTVRSQFLGTARTGINNLTLDAPNSLGFGFQNSGTGDKNPTVNGSGLTILQNYQRIDFFFSEKVSLDFLQIGDIDTATGTGSQSWRDAVGLELWNGASALSAGLGLTPTIITPAPTGSQTRLLTSTTTTGLVFAYANTIGNDVQGFFGPLLV